mgnify:CR=1 FL=1
MEDAALAELLFPNVTATPEEIEEKYPKRDLPEGAKVTRIAPSPTGFMHLGNLFGALTDERGIGPVAEQQLERRDQNGLARARFAGKRGKTGPELEPDVLDEREVFHVKLRQHVRPRGTW